MAFRSLAYFRYLGGYVQLDLTQTTLQEVLRTLQLRITLDLMPQGALIALQEFQTAINYAQAPANSTSEKA